MMSRSEGEAVLLEAGLAVALCLLVGAVGMLAYGRIAGGAKRTMRRREGPPAPGRVPDERHQHTAAVSSR
jgi:hypothetical protein